MIGLLRFTGFRSVTALDRVSLVMGGYGRYSDVFENTDFATEFYPVYTISRFGLLLSFATWGYLYFRLPRPRRTGLMLLLAAATSHYSTILFVELQILIAAYGMWYPAIDPRGRPSEAPAHV
jgi:hypothetical protein